jgi:hypothetical protein
LALSHQRVISELGYPSVVVRERMGSGIVIFEHFQVKNRGISFWRLILLLYMEPKSKFHKFPRFNLKMLKNDKNMSPSFHEPPQMDTQVPKLPIGD